jgi:hypothetical protein
MPRLAWLACLALLAALIAGCGTAGDTTVSETQTQASTTQGTTSSAETTSIGESTSTEPTASASSVPTVPPPTGKHGPHYFQTPSENIGCYLSAKGVRCDIRERSWSPPPKPKYCIKFGVDWGQGIGVGEHKKAEFVCAGDTVLGGPGLLDYGQTAQRGPFVCLSSRAGMACENSDTDHGFFLARERYRTY